MTCMGRYLHGQLGDGELGWGEQGLLVVELRFTLAKLEAPKKIHL